MKIFLQQNTPMDSLVMFDIVLFQHQQQVVTAVERAKQVTMSELNSIIGVSLCLLVGFVLHGRPFNNP